MNRLAMVTRGRTELAARLVVYGTEGIGKSTFAAGAPNPIFVQTEDGLGQIDAAKFPVATKLADVEHDLEALERQEHDYGTVVIDSLDWLERLIWDSICEEYGVTSIELAAGGYGKGYTAALVIWRNLLASMDRLRERRSMAVICVAHSKVERFEDPEAPAYDRYAPRLHKSASGLVCEWADGVLFATRRIRTLEEKTKSGGTRTMAATVKTGDDRILRCVGGPAAVAKNRYGIQTDIPLSWESFVAAMGGN